ncbi:MAG: hypothetical protein K2I64_01705 [Muribaculaceae bacterium]|nr:hypothetical protein [Muribaculaceae bacterium]
MDNNTNRLEKLIERYFDAMTTIEEERELARLLAGTNATSELIEQARAVMGYAAASRKVMTRQRRSPGLRFARKAMQIAASLALVVGGSALAIKYSSQRAEAAPRCVAYVNSVRITDEAAIRQMALEELQAAMSVSIEFDNHNKQMMTDVTKASNEITEIIHNL